MKHAIRLIAMTAGLALSSCHDDSGPTAPTQPTPQLAGTWSGSVHFRSPVSFYYGEGANCPDQAVTVSLTQHESAIDGTIQAPCVTAQFQGTIGPSLRVAYGTATQTVDGFSYTATLTLILEIRNGAVMQISGSSTPFTSSTGAQLDSIMLALSR